MSESVTAAPTAQARSNTALPPAYRLGEYVIESMLGHGGFGITYLARDTKLSSQVAIKEYFPQAFASRDLQSTIVPSREGAEHYRWGLQEFLKEARALAKFKHNHIVRVLRFLEANGTAYMVMEYEEGESLAQYLRKTGGLLKEPMLLSIFVPILSGLQAVHDAGLLHLDIKPENIYLRGNVQPMLIDFGSARQTKSGSTQDQKIALTPGYAAIEQYPNYGKQGPWTDVYSIGATLYRCVTGMEPVDSLQRYEGVRQRKLDPLRPVTSFERPLYSAYIRQCVDWAMKIPAKERPHTAFALQRGLMGHGMTNEKPVVQPGTNYRSGFIGIVKVAAPQEEEQQIKRGLMEKLLVGLILIAATGIISVKLLLENDSLSEVDLYKAIARIESATKRVRDDAGKQVQRALGKQPTQPQQSGGTPPRLAPKPVAKLPRFDPSKTLAHVLTGHDGRVEGLGFLLNGGLLASASADGFVKLWNVETGTLEHTFARTHNKPVLAASPNGQWLALANDDGSITLWDAKTRVANRQLQGHSLRVERMVFAPDSRTLASVGHDQAVVLWNVGKQQPSQTLRGHEQPVLTLAFSANGRHLATGHADGEVRYWATDTGKLVGYFRAHAEGITAIAFSPDGRWLASGGTNNFLKLWDTGLDRRDRAMENVPESVDAVVFSADSKWLIIGGASGAVRIREVQTGELVEELSGRNGNISALALSSDGKVLAAGGTGHVVELWK